MTGMVEPRSVSCEVCDFSSGQRGMDRCGKCDGTGSVFRVGLRVYPNTDQGFEAARKALNPPTARDDRERYSSWLIFTGRKRMSREKFEALPIADRARCENPFDVSARMLLPNASGILRYHIVTGDRIPVYIDNTTLMPVRKHIASEIVIRVPAMIIPAVRYAA